ncbi:MAG: Similar to CDP-glucose 4,6-dehydratase (EC [uncultured Sulfurovum sp.]|uniref:Similar to CDP-glucose 4,6-dehydratase (EC) n=1 Tax=uncultured Sulfurovum sp. TaxID=269237 RepID=A0A6S6TK99_9BACT|nr:MAG: Similar to CDP-glucose 4,6-dehydratase (EC [uncultured Sulfurovum sp.]
MTDLFKGIYKDKTVLLTGHTGFKGSWLAYWLSKMGAKVVGYSLEAPTTPNHLSLLDFKMISVIADIRDQQKLDETFATYQPDIVFHLAAQPLVRLSYDEPVDTFETNVMGTIKVFEAAKKTPSVKAIVNITSDKAYENKEWIWGYRENDPMGGYDPYSASKGCAELVVNSYRNSFFNLNDYGKTHNILLASCRAGNVIGGGDWAQDRLMTDIMLSVSQGLKVDIRSPHATRPWQHVLEPLSGYLAIGQKLLEGKQAFAEGWNFGPENEGSITVQKVVESVKEHWSDIDYTIAKGDKPLHEANLLKLDCSKANILLEWKSVWNSHMTFEKTVLWYKEYYTNTLISTEEDLNTYITDAKKKALDWTK